MPSGGSTLSVASRRQSKQCRNQGALCKTAGPAPAQDFDCQVAEFLVGVVMPDGITAREILEAKVIR
jgi:hypothetical protein